MRTVSYKVRPEKFCRGFCRRLLERDLRHLFHGLDVVNLDVADLLVLQVLLDVLVYRMDVREAVTSPRFHHQWMPDELVLEGWGFSADTIDKLNAAGYKSAAHGHIGECQAIEIDPNTGWRFGAADPRGDGKAVGY